MKELLLKMHMHSDIGLRFFIKYRMRKKENKKDASELALCLPFDMMITDNESQFFYFFWN